MIGAVVFMISDTSLAVAKFVVAYPNAEKVIMLTYYLGQMFLAASTMSSASSSSSSEQLRKGAVMKNAGSGSAASRRRKIS